MKNILLVLGMIVVLGGLYFFITKNDVEPLENVPTDSSNSPESENADSSTNTVNGMRVEENAIVVTEQRPGPTVKIAQVYLAAPGYVVIHEDNNSKAGAILGSSALLPAGKNNSITVALTRSTKENETLWSMLHSETNQNSSFDSATDLPVESKLGSPISGWFKINANAQEIPEVSL